MTVLNAAIEATLPRLRAEAEARMTSRVTVRRKTGHMVQDEDTGREVPEWAVVHADLPARLVASRVGGAARTQEIGGVEFQQATPRLDLPWDTDDLADSDYVEITSGEAAGSVYRVVEATKGDPRTARRLPVVEVPRPGEWD